MFKSTIAAFREAVRKYCVGHHKSCDGCPFYQTDCIIHLVDKAIMDLRKSEVSK